MKIIECGTSESGPKHWKNWLDAGILQSDGGIRSEKGAARSGLGPQGPGKGKYQRALKTYSISWDASDHDAKIFERLRYCGDLLMKPSSHSLWHQATLSTDKNLQQVRSLMRDWLQIVDIHQASGPKR